MWQDNLSLLVVFFSSKGQGLYRGQAVRSVTVKIIKNKIKGEGDYIASLT